MSVIVCLSPTSFRFSIPSLRVPMSNIFRNTNNIQDSSLTVIDDASKPCGLDLLFDEVAPNAILNAGGRAGEVRCYPGTREEVIALIERFMDEQDGPDSRMMWLSGPAGGGKSAIAQTVAERCQERGIHAANFFFFRSDGTRNFAQPLVATLVYQLLGLYPALNGLLTDCLTTRPLICRASIRDQFKHLLSSPIQHLSRIRRPDILIVDGLDECDDRRQQQQILRALYSLVEKPNSLFRVLVASRAEPHLTMSFNTFGTSVEHIFLDDNYRPQDDIHRFVIAKFDEIKTVHPLAHTLVKGWPADEDIDAITKKSSGQFIYAATVMRFIEYSPANPAISLLAVCRLPSSDYSPFSQLDTIYSHILSTAHNISTVKFCLGAHFLMQKGTFLGANELFAVLLQDMARIDIELSLVDLAAIIKVDTGPPLKLASYYTSLSDYLGDGSRSGTYHISEGEIALESLLLVLNNLRTGDPDVLMSLAFRALSHVENETPELSELLLDASTWQFNQDVSWIVPLWSELICSIERLYFESNKPLFELMLQHWIHFAYNNRVNINQYGNPMTTESASKYYKQYLATERVKFQRGQKK
ncbi:hypothetical protein D9619_011888 [Psilocybe cf. subviscida]|uniref:NACHT domain-containing protein n=1 Tax=Psilocybe cf. subviscida TaxID=2480587 RepID=A0A8H5EW74_9AGAR|nr:hypothetical protein D9619_011888 [Psilocybe cf. subviscida]